MENTRTFFIYLTILTFFISVAGQAFGQTEEVSYDRLVYGKMSSKHGSPLNSLKNANEMFLKVFGNNPQDWPAFILKTEAIYGSLLRFMSENPRKPYLSDFYESVYNIDIRKSPFGYQMSFLPAFTDYWDFKYGTWYSIHDDSNPGLKELYDTDHPYLMEYLYAVFGKDTSSYSRARALPLLLLSHTWFCPPQMLEWYYRNAFPVFDALYGIDNAEDFKRTIESINKHIQKLIDNGDFTKAKIWSTLLNDFLANSYFDILKLNELAKFGRSGLHIRDEVSRVAEVKLEKVRSTFYGQVASMGPYPLYLTSGRIKNVPIVFLETDRKYVNQYNPFGFGGYQNPEFLKLDHQLEGMGNQPGVNTPSISTYRVDTESNSDKIIMDGIMVEFPNLTLLGEENNMKFLHTFTENDRDARGRNERIVYMNDYVFDESTLIFIIRYNYNYFYLQAGDHTSYSIQLREPDRRSLVSHFHNLFIRSVKGVYTGAEIIPDIHGMKQPEAPKHYAIKAEARPREIKPDGVSTIEITGTLFEHVPGSNEMSVGTAGRTLRFTLNQIDGVLPGKLSSATAVTNANGVARVTFTSPDTEILSKVREFNRTSATVMVKSDDFGCEDLAYITFRPDRGNVNVEPAFGGVVSSHGIVPPDRRFPARISAYLEDDNLEPIVGKKVTFSVRGDSPSGRLRVMGGNEGLSIETVTDSKGVAVAEYIFAGREMPQAPLTETIEIRSDNMTIPLTAKVSTGLNIIFEKVENAYEGRGTINAGEQIPVRVRIKDAWNPDIDLNEILDHWGLGDGTGDTRLYARLEIENLSSIPDFLLDHLRQQNYPEAPFKEDMRIVSNKEQKQMNLLYIPDRSLLNYRGYPRVQPSASGNHYYEAKISLVDQQGNLVFRSGHPASKAWFNLKTDMPADELYIYFVQNPLRPQTKEAEVMALALSVMGFGPLLSVGDALDAINRGDSDALFGMLFSEVRGVIAGKAANLSPGFKDVMDSYTMLSLAEKIDFEIRKGKEGPLAAMERSIYDALARSFDMSDRQLVFLSGNGKQRLIEMPQADEKKDEGVKLLGGRIKISVSGVDDKTKEAVGKILNRQDADKYEIKTTEGKLVYDSQRNTVSLKQGGISYYILPSEMQVTAEDETSIRRVRQ